MFEKIKNSMQGKKSFTFGQLMSAWRQNKPIWVDWSTEKAIKDGYKVNTYVFSCINLISRASASVPWKVMKKNGDNWEEVPNHPLSQLIEKPNPFMTKKDLIERTTQHLYLGGNSIWTKVRVNNAVVELWNIQPDRVKPVPDKNKFISHYVYNHEGIKRDIEPKDIVHNMFTNPADVYWGISPLQAGAKIVDTDVESVKFNKVALQNRALTDGVFTFSSNLTREQWEQAREMIKEQHQGHENAREPWVLGNDAKWQQMSMSPAEMDFMNTRKFNREEICSLFQVPPPMLSIYENATLSNIETARKIFWLDTIIPYLEDLKSSFNMSLTPEFQGEDEEIMLTYDVSNVDAIQNNMSDKISNAKNLWSMGVPFNTINQRLELGFDDVDGGDTGFVPSGVIPSDDDFFPEPIDPQEEEDPDAEGTEPP